MYKVYKQNLAEEDLIDIWLYTYEKWGEDKADIYLDDLEVSLNLLAKNPHIGVACDYIRNGYRQLHINRHIVFYFIVEEEIHIIRILYDQMDFVKHLQGKLEDE